MDSWLSTTLINTLSFNFFALNIFILLKLNVHVNVNVNLPEVMLSPPLSPISHFLTFFKMLNTV